MSDAPERIIAKVDYDGDVDGQWLDASAPRPHSFGRYFAEYVRADLVEALQARVAELEARLELDWYFTINEDGSTTRHEMTDEQKRTHPDGITARDVTIAELEEDLDDARNEARAARNKALEDAATKCDQLAKGVDADAKAAEAHYPDIAKDRREYAEDIQMLSAAIRAMKEPTEAMRCAECTCENGGGDCNWIKPGDDDE